MIQRLSIFSLYLSAWKATLTQYRVLIILFIVNLLFSILSLNPLKNLIASTFQNSLSLAAFDGGFNFQAIGDFYLANSEKLATLPTYTLCFILLYSIWNIFATGGIIHSLSQTNSSRSSLALFWSGGPKYFFRLLRLTIYSILVYLLLIFIVFFKFFYKIPNIFEITNEDQYSSKFYILLSLLILSFWIFSIIKARILVRISKEPNSIFFWQASKEAISDFINPKILALAILNLFVFCLVAFVFYLLRNTTYDIWLLSLFLSHSFLIYRLTHKLAKLKSFMSI